jgi:hypothetical protein
MVPNDEQVQTILQSIMQSNKLENITGLQTFDLNMKMIQTNESSNIMQMKDADIITKFCKVSKNALDGFNKDASSSA